MSRPVFRARRSLFVGLILLVLPTACRRPEPSTCTVNCSDVVAETPPPCSTDDACPTAEVCDGNQCLPDQLDDASVCGVGTLSFAFDSAKLSPSNQERLAQATPCLLEQLASAEPGVLNIAGNADRLGSDDYQLGLAQRRAASIRAFLLARGLPEAQLRVVDEMVGDPRSARLTILGKP
jgi:outer membrane protein OmpA-like peptidoglycan-associated protein